MNDIGDTGFIDVPVTLCICLLVLSAGHQPLNCSMVSDNGAGSAVLI